MHEWMELNQTQRLTTKKVGHKPKKVGHKTKTTWPKNLAKETWTTCLGPKLCWPKNWPKTDEAKDVAKHLAANFGHEKRGPHSRSVKNNSLANSLEGSLANSLAGSLVRSLANSLAGSLAAFVYHSI